MILINSLYVLPHHLNKTGIIIYDNLQSQEIMKINGKSYNTVCSIVNEARRYGFMFNTEMDGTRKLFLITKDTTSKAVFYYHNLFSTTYYLNELTHYWLCPHCLSAVSDTSFICTVCGGKDLTK